MARSLETERTRDKTVAKGSAVGNCVGKRYIALILMLIAPSWAWATNYLCIAEKAGGVAYSETEDEWVGTKMTPNDRYLVSTDKLTVSTFGSADLLHSDCRFATTIKNEEIFLCDEGIDTFIMSETYLRYLASVPYFDYAINNTAGTPNIQIGQCVKL